MTLTLTCLAIAAVSTSAALALYLRRDRSLPTAVSVLFAVNLLAIVVAIVGTVVQAVVS